MFHKIFHYWDRLLVSLCNRKILLYYTEHDRVIIGTYIYTILWLIKCIYIWKETFNYLVAVYSNVILLRISPYSSL